MSDPDAPLVARAIRGDTPAFGELMERHERRVYTIALRICGNRDDARDATQDAFLTAFRKLRSFRGSSLFTTWMHRVAVNASLDLVRARSRTRTVSLDVHRDDDGPGAPEPADPDPTEPIAGTLDVAAALARVPEEFRPALVLRDVLDLSYDDVAATLEIPVGTVRSRLHRGRLALAASMGVTAGAEPAEVPGASNDETSGPEET